MHRDIVVIGGSAGALTPLCTILKGLPADPPAAFFVVLHVGGGSALHEVLLSCGARNVLRAEDNLTFEPGKIYVAPPRVHLVLAADRMRLSHGPRENRHRPSIDVLFRSGSRNFGSRVAGVLLSGALDDGAAGLFSIHARGGLAIVQDPHDAALPDMPRAALRLLKADCIAEAERISHFLVEAMNAKQSNKQPAPALTADRPGEQSKHLVPFVCPECDGPIFEEKSGVITQLACVVGHRFSPDSFTDAQRDALERALWIAVRTLENRKEIHRYLGERAKASGDKSKLNSMEEIAAASESDIALIKQIIERL